ncbi:MAG TPA: hypothetical protein VMG59_11655 [Phycisphaerae bacterium]|nr:hypothetical protein [Phycisphaerae bacterium]
MSFIFQFILAFGTLAISLLLFLLVRQIGLISNRLNIGNAKGKNLESLAVGTAIPRRDFTSYDQLQAFHIPLHEGEPTYLLFAALSCAKCRPLISKLSTLEPEIVGRLVLMCLDSGISNRYATEIANLGLDKVRIVEAIAFSSEFHILNTPYLYVVDEKGFIASADIVFDGSDLTKTIHQFSKESVKELEYEQIS